MVFSPIHVGLEMRFQANSYVVDSGSSKHVLCVGPGGLRGMAGRHCSQFSSFKPRLYADRGHHSKYVRKAPFLD